MNTNSGRFHLILTSLAGIFFLSSPGCSTRQQSDASSTDEIRIACTTAMVADIVREVAGDQAEVVGIIGEGVDPHLYKPTRNDMVVLQNADIVFYSGLHLEGKMQEALEHLASRKPVHAVTAGIDESFLRSPPEFEGQYDPHVWMDVSAWQKAVAEVARQLSAVFPDRAREYDENAKRYSSELAELHDYVIASIGSIPPERRVLITAHDAFGYFGRTYNIEVLGIQGISTESEAGLNDINRLVSLIVDRGVRAVFVETSVADKNIRALVEGARARGGRVGVGGTLYSDAMGPPGTYEGTYFGMIDHNATSITRALGGTAPARGLRDKLMVVPAEES
ncbi:MAG: metal ABC transporter solute-binding protein, Zn/Mn family [Phycisphaerae bacterium]